MTEMLSQDEVNALLTAITEGKVDVVDLNAEKEKKIKIYDFKRPERFTANQISTISKIYKTYARLTTLMLSMQLNAPVDLHIASIDCLTFEELTRSLPNPTVMGIVKMNPLPGIFEIEIDPPIAFTIIDRIFGGCGEHTRISRELTDIELLSVERIFLKLLDYLRESWADIVDLKPELFNIIADPHLVDAVSMDEMVVLVTIETKIGEVEGMMNICMPYITLEPVAEKLSVQNRVISYELGQEENLSGIMSKGAYKRSLAYSGALENMLPDDIRNLKSGTEIQLNSGAVVKPSYEYNGIKKEAYNG